MTYEQVVNSLRFVNTHLKLRERCRVALANYKQSNISLPPDFMQKVNTAIYRRRNAVSYQGRKFPGWYDIPESIRDSLKNDYPLSGRDSADMNTMLYLFSTAEEAEKELVMEKSLVLDEEVDQLLADYLSKKTK